MAVMVLSREKGTTLGIIDDRRKALNNRIAKNRLRKQRAYRLRERGYSNKEIAENLGICEAAVRCIFKN